MSKNPKREFDSDFEEVVFAIYNDLKNQSIVSRAFGIDAVAFARRIVIAWERHHSD